jgi:NAD(P)H dehydrogenase (quinone)
MPAILVMGATGGLGGQVVEFLLRRVRAENIVALARDPGAAFAWSVEFFRCSKRNLYTR